MEPFIIFIIALIELAILGALVYFYCWIVARGSGLDKLEKAQKYLIGVDKEIREPPRFRYVILLIYGIGFNCLFRSFSYTVLQTLGVLKLHITLEILGEYLVTCICSFGGSFMATVLYKTRGSSLAVPYSVALAISMLPTGIVNLIIANEQNTARDWVLWSVSIVALSLVASFIVFKFVAFPAKMLKHCQLDGYEAFPKPSSVDNAEEDEHAEGGSTDEQPTPTLQDLTNQGYTVEDVIREYGQHHEPTNSDGANAERPDIGSILKPIISTSGSFLAISAGITSGVYSYHGGNEHWMILILHIAQLAPLFVCGSWCPIISMIVSAFLKNYRWSVFITIIPFSIGFFVRDMFVNNSLEHDDSKSNMEFFCVEILRVPFAFAAVQCIFSFLFFFACLRKAKNTLRSAEPHELDSFKEEQTQTV